MCKEALPVISLKSSAELAIPPQFGVGTLVKFISMQAINPSASAITQASTLVERLARLHQVQWARQIMLR